MRKSIFKQLCVALGACSSFVGGVFGETLGYWQFEGTPGDVVVGVDSLVHSEDFSSQVMGQGGFAPSYSHYTAGTYILDGVDGTPINSSNTTSIEFYGDGDIGQFLTIHDGDSNRLEPAGSFTLEAFVLSDGNAFDSILTKEEYGTTGSVGIGSDFKGDRVRIWSDGQRTSAIDTNQIRGNGLAFGGWHHIALVFDGVNTTTFYYDYEVLGSIEGNPSDSWQVNSPLSVGGVRGGGAGAAVFSGLIDEVRFSNVALSVDEFLVATDVLSPDYIDAEETLGYWQFEGTPGDAVVAVNSLVHTDDYSTQVMGQGGLAPSYSQYTAGAYILDGVDGMPINSSNTTSIEFYGDGDVGQFLTIHDGVSNRLEPSGSFTLEAFVLSDGNAFDSILTKEQYGTTGSVGIASDFKGDRVRIWSDGQRTSTIDTNQIRGNGLAFGDWHHIALVFDGEDTTTFYYDYEVLGSIAGNPSDSWQVNSPLSVGGIRGSGAGAAVFSGLIDEVRFSNVALSVDEFLVATDVVPGISAPILWESGSLDWVDPSATWTLQRSDDLENWAHVDTADYIRGADHTFSYTPQPGSAGADFKFFRFKQVGQQRVYVVGDSISVRGAWPANFANLTGETVFTQAIGGTFSHTMVNRMRGVELIAPVAPTVAGDVSLHWHRHLADRSDLELDRVKWAEYAKSVSEPVSIEIYLSGKLVGFAERNLKGFSTDYANDRKRIYSSGHGLVDGDRVVFIGKDSELPSDLTVLDSTSDWRYSNDELPVSIVERRVYFVTAADSDSFELLEFVGGGESLDIGSDVIGDHWIECGWSADIYYDGVEPWNLSWIARTHFDDSIWLLEVSANDIPKTWAPAATFTIPNIERLLGQMTEINPRYLLVCPPSGSHPDRGPLSYNWTNYYDVYMPWVEANHPDNYIDTMAVLEAHRTPAELDFLQDDLVPELLWLRGNPEDASTWQASAEPFDPAAPGDAQMWVGPGYIPLQFRSGANFTDGIHLASEGRAVLGAAVADHVAEKGWLAE